MTDSPEDLLELAIPIARHISAHLRQSLGGPGPAISAKSTATDLVTDLDTWAEQQIVSSLLARRPHDGFLGEEGASVTGTSGVTWCIDPIDGTVNFVHGLPGFCVSIAALVDGTAVAGVVASPRHDEVFSATIGGGATCNGESIAVSIPPSLAMAVIGTGFGYDPARRVRQAAVVTQFIDKIADIRRFGAAALDLCWVAAGRLDGYWEVGLNPWDHAAGALIASEAGAKVGGLNGDAPSERGVLAASPQIWDELAAVLRSVDASSV